MSLDGIHDLQPPKAAEWVLPPPCDETQARDIAQSESLPLPVARVLVARGVTTPQSARRFLDADLETLWDPFLLPDMEKAAERIVLAMRRRERVLVHGDYDADGITSAALLVRGLRSLGCEVVWFLPHRIRDGYGLAKAGVQRASEEGARLMITVDCGSSSFQAVDRARELGIDVVVTDHHEVGSRLPQAMAVTNPKRRDTEYPFRELSGAGVALKLFQAVLSVTGRFPQLAYEYLDLVALGTVADVVPLTDENRTLAKKGLEQMPRSRNLGLRALIEACGAAERENISTHHIAFMLAPRLNAAGRMGDPGRALRLLLTEDGDEARLLAMQLESQNSRRREEEERTLSEALHMLARDPEQLENSSAVVLASDNWHPGVIGIVAARLVDLLRRPTIVIGLDGDSGKGSGRSVSGFHLFEALQQTEAHLSSFGGHEMAAGVTIERGEINAFRKSLLQIASKQIPRGGSKPVVRIDDTLSLNECGPGLSSALGSLAPYGAGNPEPVFYIPLVRVVGNPRPVGKGHLRFAVRAADGGNGGCNCIWFRKRGQQLPTLSSGDRLDLAARVRRNTWQGEALEELHVVDTRPAECS